MEKVAITAVINSWLAADKRLSELCKEEICEYDSDNAYRGYMLGFEDGVNTQVADEVEVEKLSLVTKHDIAAAYKDIYGHVEDMAALVSEEDCMKFISSSEQYWFFAGAMWIMQKLKENK